MPPFQLVPYLLLPLANRLPRWPHHAVCHQSHRPLDGASEGRFTAAGNCKAMEAQREVLRSHTASSGSGVCLGGDFDGAGTHRRV